jgi:hypothetical protein
MIIFDLACQHEHCFEAWFQSQTSYDNQLSAGLISCPHCGSSLIRRIPSAIHLAKPARSSVMTDESTVFASQIGMLAAVQQLVSAIVSNSEDVGKDFAQEARKIHYMEIPSRAIRGEASADDYASLREEGIEVLRLPILKKEDLN